MKVETENATAILDVTEKFGPNGQVFAFCGIIADLCGNEHFDYAVKGEEVFVEGILTDEGVLQCV